MFDSYEVGARCWVPSKTAGWASAQVQSKTVKSATECVVEVAVQADAGDDAETRTITLREDPSPELPLRNPPALEATADLVTLSYLNEPSVLHAIRERYSHLQIYTFSGIVLIATNPFDRVDNLYTSEVVQMYSGRQRGELEPHLFSIAEDALRCMQRDNKNQTIVVSGESGAGKTMSAKYIMRYFATVEDPAKKRPSAGSDEGLSKTEREILATNPIMEAFGNAKTTRNDNSSRFGKYLEIRFDSHLEISGARIRTYLLERSRIVFHPQTERNYHIFYQLLRGLPDDDLERLGLGAGLSAFHYVNQGDPDIAGIDDGSEFSETRQALDVVGIGAEQQWRVFEVLAALLHLGNVELKSTSRAVLVSTEDPALVKCSELLGIPAAELAKWLMKKQLQVRSQSIQSDLDAKTALVVRDSIAKYVYSALFDWLVSAVNGKLFGGNENDRFIGVLDIYGFEHFKQNSFEQFCINYANEKLQQEFNQHVFKLEQAEYETEEIDWTYIDFVDNQPCITLIEAKMGVLGLLDEESRLPAGSDEGFTHKLYGTLEGKPHFRRPRLGQSSFIVAHYAHDVEYETEGFIEKNRDTVPDTVVEMLNGTQNPFLGEILQLQSVEQAEAASSAAEAGALSAAGPTAPAPGGPRRGVTKRPTLGNMFKTSLIELMNTISSTNAHYIRCIKPNEQKEAWEFDGPMVLSQLRACGVLETIRISSMGYPGRWPYAEFVNRYDLLLHSSLRDSKSQREICLAILEAYDDPNSKRKSYSLGKTKVFMAAGMLAQLEIRRTKRHVDAALAIQRRFKMQTARAQYRNTLQFMSRLKTLSRGALVRLRAEKQRAEQLVVALQGLVRRRVQVQRLQAVQKAVLGVQTAVRTRQAKARAIDDQRHEAAVSIQTLVRAHRARQDHSRQVRALTIVQSMVRRRGARKQLQKLKEEQHSVKHFEEKQYRMENKVIELQNALSAQREEAKSLTERLAQVHEARQTAERELVTASQSHGAQSAELARQNEQLTQAVEERTAEIRDLQNELETRTKQVEQLRDTLAEQERLVQQVQLENGDLRQTIGQLEQSLAHAQTAQIGTAAVASYHRQQVTADLAAQPGPPGAQSPQQRMLVEYEYNDEMKRLNDAIEKALREPMGAKDEMLTKLIRSLEVPVPPMKSNVKPTDKIPERDVLFPANIANLIISEMWRFGLVEESEKTIGAILRTIQETVQKTSGERMIDVGPWWLTNVHEIFSFLSLAENNISQNALLHEQMSAHELHQYAALTRLAKEDATNVLFNIYHMYMKEVKKIIDKLVVPAVVEEQSIPGFKSENQHGLFSAFFTAQPRTMDDLILALSKVLSALEGFYLEDHYVKQPLKELMTLIGAHAFNDMVMRRNFLSWKRAVQINYNVTRIDEWCKACSFQEGGIPLEPITQAAKLLQLKKNYEQDASIIYDICWSLTPTQIQKLIVNYQTAEYETPVSKATHEMIARRIKEDKSGSTRLLMDQRPLSDSGPFELAAPRTLEKLEPYIPANIHVPKLRELTELTTESSRLQDQAQYYDDADGVREDGAEAQESALGAAPGPIDFDQGESDDLREREREREYTDAEGQAVVDEGIRQEA